MEQLHTHSCEVMVHGIGIGILLNNPNKMRLENNSIQKREYDPIKSAEEACYWTDDKSSIAFPAWNVMAGIMRAASGLKIPSNKHISLKLIIAGDTSITPDMIPFGTKKYEIDIRRTVVQRQSVLRARPLLRNWKLKFTVHWESQYLGEDFHKEILPTLLLTLGRTIGIGDFRPERHGPFGRFEVERIK